MPAQAEGLLLKLAQDTADEVQQAAITQLLPAILTWCQEDTLLTTCLLPGILAEAQKLLDQYALGRVHANAVCSCMMPCCHIMTVSACIQT